MTMPICENCKGCGAIYSWMKMEMITCPTCKGTGKVEQTNDEWRQSCSAEEFAEWVSDIVYECSDKMVQEDGYGCAVCNLHWCSKQDVLKWLNEVHKE